MNAILSFIRSVNSLTFRHWVRKIDKETIFNIYYIIENLQGDIIYNFIIYIMGHAFNIQFDYFGKKYRNSREPYIIYWKMIGKRYWEK